jgi:hypothetical protein
MVRNEYFVCGLSEHAIINAASRARGISEERIVKDMEGSTCHPF